MNIEQMRDNLCRVYNYAPKWVKKVKKMHDNQVIAVHKSFEARGLIRLNETIPSTNWSAIPQTRYELPGYLTALCCGQRMVVCRTDGGYQYQVCLICGESYHL